MIPQIVFTLIILIQCISTSAQSNAQLYVNIGSALIFLCVELGLLYWGGFYNNILK